MSFDPTRLYVLLLNTGLQTKDPPLYQLIHQLIAIISAINNATNTIISGGGGGSTNITQQIIQSLSGIDIVDSYDEPIVVIPSLQNLSSQFSVGDILVGGPSGSISSIPDVAVGLVLISGGVGVLPAWSANPSVTQLSAVSFKLTTNPGKIFFGVNQFLYQDNASNVGCGSTSLAAITIGSGNTAVGNGAGSGITSGINNTLVGFNAGSLIITTNFSTIVGYQAGAVYTAAGGCFFGYQAGQNVTTGINNVYIGVEAGQINIIGEDNTAIGQQALQKATTDHNTAVGTFALNAQTIGNNNTALGYGAGLNQVSGSGCVFLGQAAGWFETGSNVLIIDNTARANLGDGHAKALIYGTFDAAVANQQITINGALNIALSYAHSGAEIDKTYQIYTPLTGATITMNAGQSRAIINPAGLIAALTITLPSSPVDGQVTGFSFTQAVTVLTVNAPGGATVVASPTSAAIDTSLRFLYQASSTSWFPCS